MVKDSFGRKGIPQSQRHVPRYEARLALGIQQTRRLTPGMVGCQQCCLPCFLGTEPRSRTAPGLDTVQFLGGTQGRRQQKVREEGSRADAYGSGAVLWQRKTRVVRGKN